MRCRLTHRPEHVGNRGTLLMQVSEDRRRFLAMLAGAGAAGIVGTPDSRAQAARLETTSVRLAKNIGTCIAPQYLAEDLRLCAPGAEGDSLHEMARLRSGRHCPLLFAAIG